MKTRIFRITLFLLLCTFCFNVSQIKAFAASTTNYTLSVGDTKYLYTNADHKGVTGAAWTTSDYKSVEILSQNSASCQIRVKSYTSSTPVVIHCVYYYQELVGKYMYTRSSYTDYYITVNKPITTATTVTVTFEPNGGYLSTTSLTVYSGSTYGTLPIPDLPGYTFRAWYTESGSKVTSSSIVNSSSDHVLYAQWTPNTYTIKFNGNGSTSGSMPDMTGCQYDYNYILKANTYEKEDYSFSNWNTKADGTGSSYADKDIVQNLTYRNGGTVTLYAIWNTSVTSISDCTITLEASDYTYDGTEKCPPVSVTHGNIGLTEYTDYTVEYTDNTEAGTASVTVTGRGNYSGTVSTTFTIKKANQTLRTSISASSIDVSGTTEITASGQGTLSYSSGNTRIATVNSSGIIKGVSAGTADITVSASGNSNYNSASETVSVTVKSSAEKGEGTSGYDLPKLNITYLAAPTIASLSSSSRGIIIEWSKASGATGYEIYRNSTLIKTISSGSTTTYTDVKAKTNGTKYDYSIKACKGSTKSASSISKTTYYISSPSIKSATNISGQKLSLKWTKNSSASGYEVWYSTDKKFTSGVTRETISKNDTLSMTSDKLTKWKTYYVRVRTYKTVSGTRYYSPWAIRSVRIRK